MASKRQPVAIPERYRAGLLSLARLGETDYELFARVLADAAPTLYPPDLFDYVAARIPNVSKDTVSAILTAMLSVLSADEPDLEPEKLISDIASAKVLDLAPQERSIFRARLASLMANRSLIATSKALSILVESERPFHDARIISDVRPVYARNPAEGALAAVIVHTLVVSYHRLGQPLGQVHIAMDQEDLGTLRRVIDRAIAKGKALEALLGQAELRVLNPQEPE